jgi:transcriptional regulator with XRE-family HTH domain
MSTQIEADQSASAMRGTGVPELTALGKRIELLRIERGLAKQHLARYAGTSRQQLWRVMTGKSDLTVALAHRLADALQVDTRALRDDAASSATRERPARPSASATRTFAELVADAAALERVLEALPACAAGRRLRLLLLDAVLQLAAERHIALPPHVAALRERTRDDSR